MSATSETLSPAPSAASAVRPASWISKLRLVLAILITVSVLQYSWARSLVITAQWSWRQVERQYLLLLVVGIAAVIGLTFHLAAQFRCTALWVGRGGHRAFSLDGRRCGPHCAL